MKRLPGGTKRAAITIDFEGDSVPALEGEPIACSLLLKGETVFARSIKYHRPRGPFCMAGSCSHCLMRIDGVPNLFTCRTPARPGMRVERQNAYPSVKVDMFQSIDWLFPRGLDHHSMFAGVPIAEQVMAKVARHLAGLGLLPDSPAPERLACQTVRTRVAIAGGGAAGSAAGEVLARKKIPFVLLERDPLLGGRLISGVPLNDDPPVPDSSQWPTGSVRFSASVIGLYDDEQGRYFAALAQEPEGPRLIKVYGDRTLVAIGGHAQLPPFENNDLPGVFFGRAASLLMRRHHLLPGKKIVIAGSGNELEPLAHLARANGADIVAVVDWSSAPEREGVISASELKAHGRTSVGSASFKSGKGRAKKVSCDAIWVSAPPAPSFELARQGGARVGHVGADGVFAVEVNPRGQTNAKDLFAAGEQIGVMTAAMAAQSGARAAEAIAESLS